MYVSHYKRDIGHWRSDHIHIKNIWTTTKVILTINKWLQPLQKFQFSATTNGILARDEGIYLVVVNHCFTSLLGTNGLLSDIVIQ